MSTRGVVGFKVDGKLFLAYNHCDSYPSGLGVDTLEWLTKNLVVDRDGRHVLNPEILGPLTGLEKVDVSAEPTPTQIAKLKAHGIDHPENVSSGKDFYAWLRTCQGDLDATIKSGFWLEDFTGLEDEEWGYLINTDELTFEIFAGKPVTTIPFDRIPGLSPEDFCQRAGK